VDALAARVDALEQMVLGLNHDVRMVFEPMVQLDNQIAGEARQWMIDMKALFTDLGEAIAPGVGLPGVADRFAELRQRLDQLNRRVSMTSTPHIDPSLGMSHGGVVGSSPPFDSSKAAFDYEQFERRFRGSPEHITGTLLDRYSDVFDGATQLLDLGCGRGELVGALAERGVRAEGVDADSSMVNTAQANGWPVVQGDLVGHLRAQPDASLDVVTAFQVIEHLPIGVLVAVLDESHRVLRPGGALIVETPNPTSLIVYARGYVLDPSHVHPVHPSLATFLCEQAGFARIEQRFFAPATDAAAPLIDAAGSAELVAQVNRALAAINHHLFGPQDYAVIARKASS
jgi:predicted TPR repeat methyltransferase